MILFFGNPTSKIYAVQTNQPLPAANLQKLTWLFGNEPLIEAETVTSSYVPMLSQKFAELNQDIFTIHIEPAPILEIADIAAFNEPVVHFPSQVRMAHSLSPSVLVD